MKMKKKSIRCLIGVLLLLGVIALAFVPKEHAKKDASDWMADLDDGRALTSLVIPGTHDSGALYSIADVAGKCQSLSVKEQLKAGVRFFDIRLQQRSEHLAVVHSFVDQLTDFEEVITDIVDFLREHPSEFLIVSIKEDADAINAESSFAEAVESKLLEYADMIRTQTALDETVGDLRGKIVIISRYAGASIGVPAYHGWSDNTAFYLENIYVQDRYAISDISEKQDEILTAFDIAKDENIFTLNYISCYLTSGFPPSYAATPAKTLNPWIRQYLQDTENAQGVILCDFMTSALAETIWRCNFK